MQGKGAHKDGLTAKQQVRAARHWAAVVLCVLLLLLLGTGVSNLFGLRDRGAASSTATELILSGTRHGIPSLQIHLHI